MKKLIIAVAVVAIAMVSQAASWTWGTTGKASSKVWSDASGSAAANYAVYLFDAGITSASTLLEGIRSGKTLADYTSAQVKTTSLDGDAKLANTDVTYGSAGTSYSFYSVMVDGDKLFLTDTLTDLVAQQSDTVMVTWSGMSTMTTTMKGDAAYSTGGWYNTVPEPTSGLLMLLGVAGLALRRRRA